MTYATMADYYAHADFLPTHARLKTVADLEAHAAARERLFNDKLYLPKRLFEEADLIEFGPDTGENALAFGMWNAHCTLVEPNEKAHPTIEEYFTRYCAWSGIIEKLEASDIVEYSRRGLNLKYDFVIAEGFIYTVQPSTLWIDLFARLLRPGGMALISYYERYGGFVELFTKRIYERVHSLVGGDGLQVAHTLFDNKWNLIQHSRSFDQWFMDVILNPFVDAKYFIDAEELCQQAEAFGFRLYSSWPQYRSPESFWHKLPERPGSRAEWIKSQRDKWQYGNDSDAGRICVFQLEALLMDGSPKAIIKFCQSDETWLRLYGMPNQFCVLQKV